MSPAFAPAGGVGAAASTTSRVRASSTVLILSVSVTGSLCRGADALAVAVLSTCPASKSSVVSVYVLSHEVDAPGANDPVPHTRGSVVVRPSFGSVTRTADSVCVLEFVTVKV